MHTVHLNYLNVYMDELKPIFAQLSRENWVAEHESATWYTLKVGSDL